MSKKKLYEIRSKAFCLTINNPDAKTDEQIEKVIAEKDFQYLQYQLEEGKKRKTPHYQMYLEVKKTIRGSQVKKWFPTAHIEVRRGSQNSNLVYTQKADTKVGPLIVYGKPATQGARNDLADLISVLDTHDTWDDCIRDSSIHPQLAKYGNFASTWFNAKKSSRKPLGKLHPWQKTLIDNINAEPDNRTITWYVDHIGGKGKSEITKELVTQHEAIILGGRAATDLYQYAKSKNKVVIWDFPRTSDGFVSYSSIEKIKDGYYTSTFRNPMFCRRDYDAHVIVFSNFMPDISKLSWDRWNIIVLNDTDCDPDLKFKKA